MRSAHSPTSMLPKAYTPHPYGWHSPIGPCSCAYLVPKVLELVKSLNVQKIADLGSGNGALCHALKAYGLQPVGVEYDAQGCRLSATHYPDIPFYNMGFDDEPKALLDTEGSFDAALATEVIEHLYSPHTLPLFAKKILKPGGYLLISTPYHGYLKNLALSLLNKWDAHHTALWQGGHIKFWSERTLTQLLKDHGFAKLQFCGVGRFPLLWKSMILVAKSV